MMKHFQFLALGLLLLTSKPTWGQQFDSTYGKPLIVLIESNPAFIGIHSDVPSFALYEKGQIIYKTDENDFSNFYTLVLSQEELRKVIDSFSIIDSIYHLQRNIWTSDWTDQTFTGLYLNLATSKTIVVYGSWRIGSETRDNIPKDLLTVLDNIIKFKNDTAKEWLPQNIEVIFRDYKYAPNERNWVIGFPDLNSHTTTKNNNSYTVFIDKAYWGAFNKFFLSRGEREAVVINGKKMAISYRFPFPNIEGIEILQ